MEEEDGALIELLLTLIRNILFMSGPKHEQLLKTFEVTGIFDMLALIVEIIPYCRILMPHAPRLH